MPLHRRDFLKTSALLTAAAALDVPRALAAPATRPADGPDTYELRAYRLKAGAPAALLNSYLEQALLPELTDRGFRNVGIFTEPEPKDAPAVWVLITHPSPASLLTITAIEAAASARAAAAGYLTTPTKDQPAFDRVDSWLLAAFTGLPRLAVPALTREAQPRVFELRTYESFSEAKARNKVAMFNAGEIEVMQTLGMMPVFYGEGLVGRDLPHLTYMLCSRDRDTAAKNWKAFGQHPVWVKLKNDPQYADNVSRITSRFLTPTAYSQL
jgi:hypothetical protein